MTADGGSLQQTPANDDDNIQVDAGLATEGWATQTGGRAQGRAKATATTSRLPTPAHHRNRRANSILKPRVTRHQTPSQTAALHKAVTIKLEPEVREIDYSVRTDSDEPPSSPSSENDADEYFELNDVEMSDPPPPQRPSLKLKLGGKNLVPQGDAIQTARTPVIPASATRTPSIKLKFGGTPHPIPEAPAPKSKKKDTTTIPPGPTSKKRKRPSNANNLENEPGQPAPKPPAIRKITLTQSTQPPPQPKSAQTLKIKSKGKIPKRQLGVGYDSELEDREVDPVIHEGFILRMPPGPDCDYLRKAIEEGTVGSRTKGGADISMRMLDTQGRRGILTIKGNHYATSLVDLPCIVEGMKSWDKKGWIKSIDINQMLLVLGPCKTDDEARNYALPEDVDPKNYQYAHGLTAPMKWVRKRRFARTKRARVDDIEAVERRVNALLEADKAAISSQYQLLDHDPRLDEERYSPDMDDEDAEGEDDEEADGYFAIRHGQHDGAFVETPMFTETPVEDIGQDEVDEFERMFAGDDDAPTTQATSQAHNTLHVPEVGDSSFAVTSTSASPSITVAHTPASGAEPTSDEDDDDDGGEDDEDLDDAEKEGDENLQQVKDRIEDMQQKIAEQTEVLKKTQNAILKKKLARKIQDLKDDVAMMKKSAGLRGDEDDD
ncbi:uncharacterized protein Z518_09007 [Rhinocladiella mackenziei CBS 650.93]|uniref:Rhinocladiella mackenziei CBS 650.93 unplaced genomic scaffold supercont1.7, whole genome shotgun sequence n=1 Tax=Rhinocladiella mackenziei CBS 650.93 TaxID=1442369 RepID=A0A0D2FGX2_9EURO|nr:uncharacterized protein Z518_09007 [Rhinocladiella mackenziei CBS 650.93]KIX01282.1 hypothetical protein Z518_09007 [Rhinocladiella mackenziei CBS 650.93]